MAHNANIEFKLSGQYIMASFAFLAPARHTARAADRLGINTIDKVTTCHQAIGCSGGAGGNFDLTAGRRICAGNMGTDFVMDNVSWSRYRVN